MIGRESYPARPLGRADPLVTAEQGFPAMERVVAAAEREILMGFRIFDPTTGLRAPEVAEAAGGERRWADLLAERHRAGVAIRIALSDFDPVAEPVLHGNAWDSARRLAAIPAPGGAPFSVMVALHPSRVGRWLKHLLWPAAIYSFESQRRALNELPEAERSAIFAARPGLWPRLRARYDGRIVWRLAPPPRLHPVTHHQKILVADRRVAVIGGLDIDERRWDDLEHSRDADETWHDVALAVDGPVVADIAEFLDDAWWRNRRIAARRVRRLGRRRPYGAPGLPPPPDRLDRRPGSQLAVEGPVANGDEPSIRLLRTISDSRRRGALSLGPRPRIREFLEAYKRLIAGVRQVLYVETQFFRNREIADALCAAASRRPELNLVLVVPAAPEPVAFEDAEGLPERLGEHLHAHCVDQVRAAFGERAAVLSPARPAASASEGRDATHGAHIVYVHAKLMIADLEQAIVGSANLNGRSLLWDTEAGVLIRNRDAVERLAGALIEHWFVGSDPGADRPLDLAPGAAPRWRALAERMAALPPAERRHFLLPHDAERARELGHPVPLMPDELV